LRYKFFILSINIIREGALKSLFRTVATITFFAVITRILGFFFRIYLSRMLGAEALGIYQISLSVFMVLLTIIGSGLPIVISKITAKLHTKNDKVSEGKLVSTSLIISLVTSLILIAVILIFKNLFSAILTEDKCYTILVIMLPAVLFSGVYSVFRGALWGHSNYFGFCLPELFEQIARITICIFLLSFGLGSLDPAISAGLSLTIACFLSSIMAVVMYFIYGGRLKKPVGFYREVFRSSAPITGLRVLTSFVQPLIAFIIPARLIAAGYTNSQALSLFGIATGMTIPLLFIPITLVSSLSLALIPDISSALSNKDVLHINNRISSSLTFTLFITFLMIPLFWGAGENIGAFFFSNQMSGALLSSASWIILPLALTNITSSILNALGMEVKSFINYIIGSVFLFLGLWFLPQLMGIKALIYAMGVCVSITTLLNIWMIKRKTKVRLGLLKPLLLMSLFTIPTAALTFFTTNLLNNFIPLFFNLAVSCSLGAGMFFLLCMIFNIVNIRRMFVEVKKIKFKKSKRRAVSK
jgi:stage V sporulation protein B